MHLEQVAAMLGARLEAFLGRHFVVVGEGLHGGLQFGRQHQIRVAVLGRPGHRVAAHHAGNPDRRVRGLVGARPGIHVAVVVVLALPAERAGLRPGLDDEVVRLLEALPVVGRHGVVRHALAPGAAHPAGDEAATRDHVDLGQLFGEEQRVVPDRQDVAEQHDLGAARDARQDRRLQIHHAAHAERRGVVLVQHQAVEAHLLGEDALVQIAVVEIGAEPGIVAGVGHAEVHDAAPGGAEVAGTRVLVRTLGEVADEHSRIPLPLHARPQAAVYMVELRRSARARRQMELGRAKPKSVADRRHRHTSVGRAGAQRQRVPHGVYRRAGSEA